MIKKLLLVATFISTMCATQAQNGLNLDGVDDYVSTTYPGISGNGARTVEAWIRTTSNNVPSQGGKQHVIADWGSTTTGGRFTLNILFNPLCI